MKLGWGEYLGYIDVTYDPSGKILAYHGAPIHLNNKTSQDTELQAHIKEWRKPFEEFAAQEIGQSNVELDQTTCQKQECLLGDFMTDAMLAYRLNISDIADFALINSGGIRATIGEGPITRGEVLTSFPFGNSIVELELDGEELWMTLEGVVAKVNQFNKKGVTSFIQVSKGITFSYNPTANNGSKLVEVIIGDSPLDRSATYNIVTLDFLAGGGDNIFQKKTGFASLDTQDAVLTQYIISESPVDIALDGRIKTVNGSSTPTESGTPTACSSPTRDGANAGNMTFGGLSVNLLFGAAVMGAVLAVI
jgi:2',3'-cyclic-nucleotide 2'-phosphodiesterase (5'-nucleotidase family)